MSCSVLLKVYPETLEVYWSGVHTDTFKYSKEDAESCIATFKKSCAEFGIPLRIENYRRRQI